MDSDSDVEFFPVNDYGAFIRSQVFEYNDPLLVPGLLRAVVTEDLEKIKQMIRSGRSVNINDINGNKPLHVAVIKKNLNIVKYLLAEENIVINARNFLGQTALFVAVKIGSAELAQCLVDNGANVNLPNSKDVTPLHVSVKFPNIAHLLIKNGANIDVSDFSDDTPLHDAVAHCHLETVCMFLYYNADANRRGNRHLTPFMNALINKNHALQELLIDYVDDFNVSTLEGIDTLLSLAIRYDSQFVEEIIKRGAKVDELAYKMCIKVPNPENFKLVWKNLPPEEAKYYVGLDKLCFLVDDDPVMHSLAYMDIILEDTNGCILELLADHFRVCDMALVVDQCVNNNLNLDTLTKLMCLLLQYGYQLSGHIIHKIFINYGYSELFKILLFMDYDSDWQPDMITSRLIFEIRSDMKKICTVVNSCRELWSHQIPADTKRFFQYWNYRPLIDTFLGILPKGCLDRFRSYIEKLPKLPSLVELARNKTREHIVERLNLSTASQYYTVINSLNIAPGYKNILMFELKLYNV